VFNAVSLIARALVLATLLGAQSPVQAEEQSYRACLTKSDPMTREEAVCRFAWKTKHSEAIDAERLLRETTSILPGRIFEVVEELNRKRAQCEYEAIHEFSISRTDVSFGELLEWYAGEPLEERDYLRLNNLPDGEPLGDAIHQCQKAYWEDVQVTAQSSERSSLSK
jgi:hypothetical protein